MPKRRFHTTICGYKGYFVIDFISFILYHHLDANM